MKNIDVLLDQYGESHQDYTNKIIHWICVPAIFWSIVGLVWSIPTDLLDAIFPNVDSDFLNWATIALVAVLLYYFTLSLNLFFGMSLVVIGLLFFSRFIEMLHWAPLWQISIGVFVVAWIGQFYGHHVEGKKPSFLKDVQFLLIGPAWLLNFVYKKIGVSL